MPLPFPPPAAPFLVPIRLAASRAPSSGRPGPAVSAGRRVGCPQTTRTAAPLTRSSRRSRSAASARSMG